MSTVPCARPSISGAIGYDAIKHLVLCRVERRPPRLDLDCLSLPATGAGRDHQALELPQPDVRDGGMSDTPQVLLQHHLKKLKLPTFQSELRQARPAMRGRGQGSRPVPAAALRARADRAGTRMIERRVEGRVRHWSRTHGRHNGSLPATKSLDSFDFTATPTLNKVLTMELARGEFIDRRENIIALGPSGTGKTHVALGLGLAACQKGLQGPLHHCRSSRQRADRGP